MASEKEEHLAERTREESKIAAYQREKALREKELEERKREMMAIKEREIAALYAKHEKVMDKQAEMDALRARRYVPSLRRQLARLAARSRVSR